MRGRRIIWLVLCLQVSFSFAQESIRFRHLSKEQGLVHNAVFAIGQDNRGIMWFGTRQGLSAYDGYKFRTYRHSEDNPNTIPGNDVRTLQYDSTRNVLWIGGLNGLSAYRFYDQKFVNYGPDSAGVRFLTGHAIRDVFIDSEGAVWAGTSHGVSRMMAGEESFTLVDQLGECTDVKAFAELPQGILCGTACGLTLIEASGKSTPFSSHYSEFEVLDSVHVKSIDVVGTETLWVGTQNHGMFQLGLNTGTLIRHHKNSDRYPLSHNNVRSTAVSANGTVWVGTFVGLNKLDPERGSFQQYYKEDAPVEGLRGNSVRSVFVDAADNLWVGTYYRGIHFTCDELSQFQIYRQVPWRNSVSFDVISSFQETAKGDLWVGTEGGGLNLWDRSTGQFTVYDISGPEEQAGAGNSVKDLLLDGDELYIGTFQDGLRVFDINKETTQVLDLDVPDGTDATNAYRLLKDGESLWVATYGHGLKMLNTSTGKVTSYTHSANVSESLSSDLVRTLTLDASGQLWVGTEDGLNQLSNNPEGASFSRFLSGYKIYAATLIDGNIWLGTYGRGLIVFDPARSEYQEYRTEDGLPGNLVLGIVERSDGSVWLSTDQGIASVAKGDMSFTNYAHTDGLENLEFNYNASLVTSNDEIVFGSTNGFTLIDPSDLKISVAPPKVVITDIDILNEDGVGGNQLSVVEESIGSPSEIKLKHGEANFTIHFAVIDYRNPSGNKVSWRMRGLSDDWTTQVGASEATFTLQEDGLYTFELRGASKDGIWNEDIQTLTVNVLPPWWRTTLAYCIYLIIGIMLLLVTIRVMRMNQRIKLSKYKLEQQSQLDRLKTRFFTNIAHEFRTPVTLIMGPLEQIIREARDRSYTVSPGRLSAIYDNAQRLSTLVDQLLTFRRMEEGYLKVEPSAVEISQFVKNIFASFVDQARLNQIDYNLRLDVTVSDVILDRDKMEIVLFNLLSNAFKFTPKGGAIDFTVTSSQDNSLVFVIRDNGKGIAEDDLDQIFLRFYERNVDRAGHNTKGTGIGLSLSKELVELHEGKIEVESSIGQGATFTITMPLKPATSDTEASEAVEFVTNIKNGMLLPEEILPQDGELDQTLLIVEDNPDMRDFLKTIFTGLYRIITAADGAEGLATAQSTVPDLIISDVMMPEMDGYQLCHQLRNSIETSHIPIILLTAKSTEQELLEGLEMGADDYMTKPFHPQELRLKVQNILRSRANLQERVKSSNYLHTDALDVSTPDEMFLRKLGELVEENLANPDFHIDQFAQELAVSRALLFTKIKALTGMTPKKFLVGYRLKRASVLLEKHQLNISEVAFMVGFNDPRYFSKVFSKEFGVKPSEYRARSSV